MAEEQIGGRKEDPRDLPLWMKLFTGFKVALDPKKLILAAAGLVVMAFGWWICSIIFWDIFTTKTPPKWEDYKETSDWKTFKVDRIRWNLRYEMAGTPPYKEENGVWRADPWKYDAADLAGSAQEYEDIKKEMEKIRGEISKRTRKVFLGSPDPKAESGPYWLQVGREKMPDSYRIPIKDEDVKALKAIGMGPTISDVVAGDVTPDTGNKILIKGVPVEVSGKEGEANAQKLFKELSESKSITDIEQEIRNKQRSNPEITRKALKLVGGKDIRYKPYGLLRTWPWFEDRGPNPYLLITGKATPYGDEAARPVPWARGEFATWFVRDQFPVLIEPLVKFLRPVVYLFDPGAGGWNRLYLVLVILWVLFTWAVFGGAITRMAAVQVARPNEKVGMMEAFRFATSRFKSFFSAPLFPLLFLLVLTVILLIYGLVAGWTFFFGDIVVDGLFWPLVLLIGLIMAVVLVGLVGWPLMYSTISTEGSDSFDAISRSYSYVYQAPWHYLWYGLVAIGYGAVLVFFVGLMGSLMVYLGKWGVERAPVMDSREPTYLFRYAPTSYGWRDLLLYNQPDTETLQVVHHNGAVGPELTLSPTYKDSMSWSNYIGAILVSIWIYILFLMVAGFAYSYFWSASTIIYLMMRRKVDDTEMDEVHLEEEEFEEPAPRPTPAAAPPAPAPAAGGRTMVEAPTIRTPAPASTPVSTMPPTAPSTAVVTATPPTPTPPVSTAPKTQLATEPLMEGKDGASAGKLSEKIEPPNSSPESGGTSPPSGPAPEEGKP